MSKALKEALNLLVNSSGDIHAQAASYAQSIPVAEVQEALDKSDPDSVEMVVLAIMLRAYKPVDVKAPKAKAEVIANSAT